MFLSSIIIKEISSSKSGRFSRTFTEVANTFQFSSCFKPFKTADTKSSSFVGAPIDPNDFEAAFIFKT